MGNWSANIQDWLLPRLCPACGDRAPAARGLCPFCERGLPVLRHACPRCAIPYAHPDTRGICGACQQHPPAFTRALALYRYAPPVDHFLRALKFHQQLGLARLLGERLAQRLLPEPARPDLILPVPLHRTRLRRRGYNQALEIARPVARALDVPLDFRSLVRIRPTLAQSELPVEQRRQNVRGAFAVRAGANFEGLRLALLDDVMTTGNTADAACRALRKAGAREVEVWVIARV